METYQYTALSQGSFRLLCVELQGSQFPSSAIAPSEVDNDAIKCSLQNFLFESAPDFDALSYTWGTPTTVFANKSEADSADAHYQQKLPVICDGKITKVGQNLHDALSSLRKLRRSTTSLATAFKDVGGSEWSAYIWIDAMCINQQDILERNTQVAMMHKIYSKARKVFIWLWRFDCFVRPAFKIIEALQKVPMDRAFEARSSNSLERRNYNRIGLPPITVNEWLCLYGLLQRLWFRRVWIVQEVALSRFSIVMCGGFIFNWGALARAAIFLDKSHIYEDIMTHVRAWSSGDKLSFLAKTFDSGSSGSQLKNFFELHAQSSLNCSRIIMDIQHLIGGFGINNDNFASTGARTRMDFFSLLKLLRRSSCADPRDRVYATIGLLKEAKNSSSDLLTIDYNKPVSTVYLEAAWAVIRSTKDLRLLSWVRTDQVGDVNFPSWVPDWRYAPRTSLDEASEIHSTLTWATCGTLPWVCSPSPALSSHLPVEGAQVGLCNTLVRFDGEDLWSVQDVFLSLPSFYVLMEKPSLKGAEFPCVRSLLGLMAISTPGHTQSNSPFRYLQILSNLAAQTPKAAWAEIAQKQGHSTPIETDEHENTSFQKRAYQTRFEVFWRTLIHDTWQGQHPAPIEAGYAFVAHLAQQISFLIAARHLADDKKINRKGVTVEQLRTSQDMKLTILKAFSGYEVLDLMLLRGYQASIAQQDSLQMDKNETPQDRKDNIYTDAEGLEAAKVDEDDKYGNPSPSTDSEPGPKPPDPKFLPEFENVMDFLHQSCT